MPKKCYDLHLKGYVGMVDFNPKAVDNLLDEKKDCRVNVLIDSTGGSLASGLSISAAFKRHGDVSVHYVGMNASAATIASMGAKHVSIDRAAMYLVHKGSMAIFEWGSLNADQLDAMIKEYQKMKADLDKIDLHVAAIYASRCKKPVADLLELMKEGAWLTPDEALEWGFVDEITEFEEDMPAVLHTAEASAMSKAGIPLPNMPVISEGWDLFFKRLEDKISNLFNLTSSKFMAKSFKYLCALLGCSSVEFNKDGRAQLSEDDFDKIEGHISSLESKLAASENSAAELTAEKSRLEEENNSLKAQIEELRKEPAAVSTSVVDDTKKDEPEDKSDESLKDFLASVASAKAYFKNRK